MATTKQPVLFTTIENASNVKNLKSEIKATLNQNDASLILDYPTVYLHVWQNDKDFLAGTYSIYIGESNDVVQRTNEHWHEGALHKDDVPSKNWQTKLINDRDDKGKPVQPQLFVFGHEYFNKSLTLDIENRLIDYCLSIDEARPNNGRSNPQGKYAGDKYLDDIFGMIWRTLRHNNKKLFLPESSIKKSALFKASPKHKLTDDQEEAKSKIIDRVLDAIINNKTGQLIFVEGEAGTGKTVLTNSTFYDLIDNDIIELNDLECYLLINHDEQFRLCQNMARKLGYSEDIVAKPITFLNNHSILDSTKTKYIPEPGHLADVVFIDEGHLLWDQTNQAFNTKYKGTQLEEIIKRSRVTVMMFDGRQVLKKAQMYDIDYMNNMRNFAKSTGIDPINGRSNYIELINQLRMACSNGTMGWIDAFTKDLRIDPLYLNSEGKDSKDFEVKIFDDPQKLHDAIKAKAANPDTQLARVIATYDWKFIEGKSAPAGQKYWEVKIGDFTLPWNEQIYHVDLEHTLSRRQKAYYERQDWAEKDYTINEAGSTFTIQGFDLAFAGVIIGPSVKYDPTTNRVYFDESERAWDKMTGTRTMRNGKVIHVSDTLSQNELRVLMTRATEGLYIYACNDELRKALKKCVNII